MNNTLLINRYTLAVAFVLAVTINGLANYLPFNGISTGAVSDSTGALFAPAPYVFSIWGLIYLALAVHVVYQFTQAKNTALQPTLKAMQPWLIINLLLNAAWMIMWHYGYFGVSVLVMLGILLSLIGLFVQRPATTTWGQWWAISFPVQLYLGWISVATIANIAAWLSVNEWSAFGVAEDVWVVIMTVIALVLAMVMIFRERSYVFAAVVGWAAFGLYVKFFTNDMIAMIGVATPVILLFAAGVRYFSKSRK